MKFRATLALSIVLHGSLAALFIIQPARKPSGGMTYYVDLVRMGGGGGGGGGGGRGGRVAAPEQKQEPAAQAALIEDKGGVKNLTVEKEFRSPLRFPDKESKKKVEENKMISVVRKEPAVAKSEAAARIAGGEDGLKTGIASSGDGSGGWGGPGGQGGSGYFPHAYYIDLLRNRISSSWYSSLVAPGLKGKFVTGVHFIVRRNGEISDLRVERPSGNASLDLSARRAIENASPFAPLPNDFSSQYLVVHFEFEWEK